MTACSSLRVWTFDDPPVTDSRFRAPPIDYRLRGLIADILRPENDSASSRGMIREPIVNTGESGAEAGPPAVFSAVGAMWSDEASAAAGEVC
ncbi:hypothetical protein GCM10022383_12760 [Microbacterium soli]|uniref:Uncharacterized protein n=1 Tax=Microbacterium soli TaxID=446075 RepID=A0ABP7N6P5_9MICO